jgi:hypothetical protein
MICTNGHVDLHHMHVDFAQWVHGFSTQWLSQVDPRKPVHCTFVRGLKGGRKGHMKTITVLVYINHPLYTW